MAYFGSAHFNKIKEMQMALGKKQTYVGTIVKETVCAGSKSEYIGILLHMDDGRKLPLRLKGANPFEIDPALNQLVGSRATVQGIEGSGIYALLIDDLSDISVQPNIYPRRPRGPGF
jgi:hypothetical protein